MPDADSCRPIAINMIERIENYFEKKLSAAEKAQFEDDLKSDPELANAVAFYITARKVAVTAITTDVANDERKKMLAERHAEWKALKTREAKYGALRTWYAIAAAVAFIAFGLAWYFTTSVQRDLQPLASGYVMENFTTLSVQMGDSKDSVQLAISNYNKGQYATARKIYEDILRRDPQNAEAKKIAGIVSLKLLDYDKAITYFHQLGQQQNLYANPGKFYEAIALLQRDLPLDKKKAEDLLIEVIDNNLEGKEEAVKWVK